MHRQRRGCLGLSTSQSYVKEKTLRTISSYNRILIKCGPPMPNNNAQVRYCASSSIATFDHHTVLHLGRYKYQNMQTSLFDMNIVIKHDQCMKLVRHAEEPTPRDTRPRNTADWPQTVHDAAQT
jgi:hypothetical protein